MEERQASLAVADHARLPDRRRHPTVRRLVPDRRRRRDHPARRHPGARTRASRSLTLVAVVVLLAAISAPTVWEASTHESLQTNLQGSQNANASDNSNLSLEQVDFSTREAIIVNLPQRILDVLTRPYPWQLGNTSQQLGLLGTIFAFTCFWLLALELWRARGQIMERAGPLVYVGFFLLIAYSLSAGNAGTAFRYRTHVVALAVCLLVVLRELRTRPAAAPAPARTRGREPRARAEPRRRLGRTRSRCTVSCHERSRRDGDRGHPGLGRLRRVPRRGGRERQAECAQAPIVVVDNASSTPVPELEGCEVVRAPRRLSVGAARNLGLEQVATEYVVFLDADDMLLEGDPGLPSRANCSRPGLAVCRDLDPGR